MTSFCVDTVAVPNALRAQHGILRSAALQVTSDAEAAARKIIEAAHAEARNVLTQAHREAESVVNGAERQVFERAQELLQSLQNEQDIFLERGKDIILDLASTVFERLVAEMPQRERVEAALKRVTAEAPRRLINPVLRVHPTDVNSLPALEWDIKEDTTLAPGSCKLVAGNGEWYVNFDAALSSLREAFASFAFIAPQDGDSEVEPDWDISQDEE